jgi:hypothetical protein
VLRLKLLFLCLQEERFKIYATYCKNFDRADSMLKQKIKKNKEFERFLKVCLLRFNSKNMILSISFFMFYELRLKLVLIDFKLQKYDSKQLILYVLWIKAEVSFNWFGCI